MKAAQTNDESRLSRRELTQEVGKLWEAVHALQSTASAQNQSKAASAHRLMTPREASKRYRIGRRQLMAMIENGELPAIKRATTTGNGCRWRLRREDCDPILLTAERMQPERYHVTR